MAGYQILGIRSYYDEKERKDKRFDAFFERRWRFDDIAELFKDPLAILERNKVPAEERWNLFYTVSNCGDSKREFKSLELIPFDVDGIDLSRIAEYIDPILEIIAAPGASVIASGNGLHFLTRISEPFTDKKQHEERRSQYKAVLSRINRKLEELRLPGKADPAVWDVARILRMPGTINRKPDKQDKVCTILRAGSMAPTPFDWDAISGAPKLDDNNAVSEAALRKYRKHSGEEAMQQCLFLKHTKEDAATLSELEWYAAASVIGRFTDGVELFHAISSPHRSYSPAATDEKLAQALAASGPRTCANINNMWGKCHECPLFGKIKSPIVIKSEEVIATEASGFYDVIEQKDKAPKLVPNYNDLLKAFERDNPYFYDAKGEIVYAYQATHWQRFFKPQLRNYAEKQFNPTPTDRIRSEFASKVAANHVWSPNRVEKFLFGGASAGKINLQNGVLTPITKELAPHSSEYGFTYVLPYDYMPGAKCPTFDRFISEVTLGRKELQDTLLDFMAYTLVPRYDHHCFLWLTASGRNGKSTYMNMLSHVVGEENAGNVLLDQFEDAFSLAQISHKLVNFSEESESRKITPAALTRLKLISGGGGVSVSEKNEKNYNMRTTCKLVFASNVAPGIDNIGQAIHSRMIVVPFDLDLEDMRNPNAVSKVDLDLEDEMKKELPGILNLLVDRLHARGNKKFRVSENKFTNAAKEEIFRSSDTLERWLHECAALDPNATSWAKQLHDSFDEFMGNEDRSNIQGFIQRLKKKFPKKLVFSERKRNTILDSKKDYEIVGIKLVGAGSDF